MTFSLLAKDSQSGALACATATGLPAIGAYVPHVRTGAGAIATQGFTTNRLYGLDGLELLSRGWLAHEVLKAVVDRDEGRSFRQCLVLDSSGDSAHFTGEDNDGAMAVEQDHGWIAGGNMLASTRVIQALASAYVDHLAIDFPERLLRAMAAAEAAGGDKRGACSMALLIEYPDGDRIDLRIDSDISPVEAMMRLWRETQSQNFRTFAAYLPTQRFPHRSPKSGREKQEA